MKIRTIYEKSYRPIKFVQASYRENLTYRRLRTLTERSHQALEWPDDSSDSEATSSSTSQIPIDTGLPKPPYATDEPVEDLPIPEISQTSNHENHPMFTSDEAVQVGSDIGTCFYGVSPASNSNSQKRDNFALYGSGDLENINGKLTFNVKSSRDVHPSALRALENRRDGLSHSRLDKKISKPEYPAKSITRLSTNQSQKNAKSKPLPNSSSFYLNKSDLLNAKNSSSHVDWQSEYNSKFPTYPTDIYSQSAKLLAYTSVPHLTSLNNLSRKQPSYNRIDEITARMARSRVLN